MKQTLRAILALACLLSNAHAANILLNPGFELPDLSPNQLAVLGSGSTFLNNWTVTGLDDVFLEEVPEPATIALTGVALLAVGTIRRRTPKLQ